MATSFNIAAPVNRAVVADEDTATSTDNADAVITYSAAANTSHCISGLIWSYDGTPAGSITIEDGTDEVFSVDVTAAGPGFIPFDPPKKGSVNTDMVITLSAGGAGIVGKVNAMGHWTE